MAQLLSARDISLRFGGLQVLENVSLDVGEWEIVGLIGPNGAGKTSFFNCLTGIYQPDGGSVWFHGRDVSRLPTHRRSRMGIARTWQNLGVVGSLTIFENVLLAQHGHAGYHALSGLLGLPRSLERERQLRRDADEVIDFVGLSEYAGERVSDLPYGVQKLADLAMALATDPVVLLLDEPSSGMSPEEARSLGAKFRELRETLKLTIVMIEHHVPLVVDVCDYVYVLNFGQLLAQGKPEKIQHHPEVVAAYLGGAHDAVA